jgi:cytochrome c-type biogenesis protein CcmE
MAHATETIAVQPVGGREGSGLFSGPVKLAVGGAVVVAALAYFAFMAFQSATVYYYTVGELQERGATAAGETVRVSGKLVDGSFSRDTDSTLARFALTDGATDLPATHDGVLPELFFNEHSEVILEGNYTPEGVFQSHNVIVKCPSKYAGEDA